ncbi:MAG: hypothetical protein ABI231_11045 [Candidatus Tumulicola sp.]
MNHAAVTILAGLFLGAFGALGAWFLTKRHPSARFLRAGYALMSAGGVLFVAWALSRVLAVGVTAAALVGIGGVTGMIGALRKELRSAL